MAPWQLPDTSVQNQLQLVNGNQNRAYVCASLHSCGLSTFTACQEFFGEGCVGIAGIPREWGSGQEYTLRDLDPWPKSWQQTLWQPQTRALFIVLYAYFPWLMHHGKLLNGLIWFWHFILILQSYAWTHLIFHGPNLLKTVIQRLFHLVKHNQMSKVKSIAFLILQLILILRSKILKELRWVVWPLSSPPFVSVAMMWILTAVTVWNLRLEILCETWNDFFLSDRGK